MVFYLTYNQLDFDRAFDRHLLSSYAEVNRYKAFDDELLEYVY